MGPRSEGGPKEPGFNYASAYIPNRTKTITMEFSVPEQWSGIWGSIQAGIILVDAETHRILAANPEAQRMTGCDTAVHRVHP